MTDQSRSLRQPMGRDNRRESDLYQTINNSAYHPLGDHVRRSNPANTRYQTHDPLLQEMATFDWRPPNNGKPSNSLDDSVGKDKGRDKPPTTRNSLWLSRKPKRVLTEVEIQEARRQEAEIQEARRQEARRQEAEIQEARRQEAARKQYFEEEKLKRELIAAGRKGKAIATEFVEKERKRVKRVGEAGQEIFQRAKKDAEFEISEPKRAEELNTWLNNTHRFIKDNPHLVTYEYINRVITNIRANATDTDLQYLYGTVRRKVNPDEAWKLIKNIIDSLRSRR
jgi:hypothetical protein